MDSTNDANDSTLKTDPAEPAPTLAEPAQDEALLAPASSVDSAAATSTAPAEAEAVESSQPATTTPVFEREHIRSDEQTVVVDDEAQHVEESTCNVESESDDDEHLEEHTHNNHYEKRRTAASRSRGGGGSGYTTTHSAQSACRLAQADSPEHVAPLPEVSGWITKSSASWFVGWQQRWMVVRDRQLRWYERPEDEQAHKPLATVDFDLIACQVERTWQKEGANSSSSGLCGKSRRGRGCCTAGYFSSQPAADEVQDVVFRVLPAGSNRAFEFNAPNAEDGHRWVDSILEHIKRSHPPRNPVPLISESAGAWWKVSRISPEKFSQIADTGDILLFRSKGAMPRLIRAAGRGRYDHVGLILKLAEGEVGILEATGGEGVGVCTWQEFMQNEWHLLYPELALRRVRCDRSGERLRALQTWLGEVMGKPYSLTVNKLMRRQSLGSKTGDEDYYCSQLVAEALKVFGVLPRGKASTQYWPSTFSAKKEPLDCMQGCSFDGEDLMLDFSLLNGAAESTTKKPGAPTRKRDATTNWG